ncbi:hypothetical protein [Colwellia psychrerythraea]|uniref:Uncharacterized protein n=1 Tax=Colwellia psychrerythraea TaxID=28229 RepID=A0A099KIE1_COLPS|nr:hypothetical protein [Colwellia psychrerythraea]KGJ90015.1 hypothetical protein ND2E_3571 [Colwellia psychrerythraea]
MMINNHYIQQVSQTKSGNALALNSDNSSLPVRPIPGEKDTLTLSDKALAMMKGHEVIEIAPSYVRPETARSLLTQSRATDTVSNSGTKENTAIDNRFGEMMQSILNQRLGIDNEKLEEIEAEMEEIANNENMSPEEKQKALEELAQQRDKFIEESIEKAKVVQQTK